MSDRITLSSEKPSFLLPRRDPMIIAMLYSCRPVELASEMKKNVGTGFSKQLFVTTHSPFFVNALTPEQVWVLEKGDDGFSTIQQASTFEFVSDLVSEGVAMGDLWYSRYFG